MNLPFFLYEASRGRSIYRIHLYDLIRRRCAGLQGRVLDLACGDNPSYRRYLEGSCSVTSADLSTGSVVDFDEALPFEDATFDSVIFFNAIYIARDPVYTLCEIYRVLKPKGTLYLASPFVANEMPEPHDFCRFTKEGLERIFQEANFTRVEVERFGERFSSAAYILYPVFFFSTIRLVVNAVCIGLDRLLPASLTDRYPTPLGYFVMAKKI